MYFIHSLNIPAYIKDCKVLVTAGLNNCISFWGGSAYSLIKTLPVVQPQLCFAYNVTSTNPLEASSLTSAILASDSGNVLSSTLRSGERTSLDLLMLDEDKPKKSSIRRLLYSGGQCCDIHTWDLDTVCSCFFIR